MAHDKETLKALQEMPLEDKIMMTKLRILEFYEHFGGKVYVSFSGGKDSTVLLHIARELFPNIPAVFSNTGLEYPEIQAFVREQENVDIVRPAMQFNEVIRKYGYPVISKEVAEAIYYARRIIRNGNEEKTPVRKRSEMNGERIDSLECMRRRSQLSAEESQEETNSDNDLMTDASENVHAVTGGRTGHRRLNLQGLPSDTIRLQREGKPLSTNAVKSQFNKQKWLPLCQKADFKISHYCCTVMKKQPIGRYQRQKGIKPIIGTLTEESRMRKQAWLRHGCNVFEGKASSQPLSFWTEQDILRYLAENHLKLADVYGEIISDAYGHLFTTRAQRTGCIFCAFSVHMERNGDTRFQQLKQTHPRQYEYCMNGGEYIDNPDYDPDAPEVEPDGWVNWNPEKIWVPSKEGLGLRHVFEVMNGIYGEGFIRYE